MATKTKKIYNINEMHRAIVKARENGNRGTITKSLCNELGISEAYYEMYISGLERLYEAVKRYCVLKNSAVATPEEKNAALEAIYPRWKTMLECAESDKFTKTLRVSEHDISNLVGYCQLFVNDKNDVSLGDDKEFKSQKLWASMPFKRFQKAVETDLGIRIAQVEVMSDEERDFLNSERKILTKWKKAKVRVEELTKNKIKLEEFKAKATTDEARDFFNEQIEDIDKTIASLNEKIEGQKKAHYALLHPEENVEDAKKADTPKAAAATKKTKKAKSTTKEVLVAKS